MIFHNNFISNLHACIASLEKHCKYLAMPAMIGVALTSTPSAYATQGFLNDFNNLYGKANTNLDSCGLCHMNFSGGGTLNPYGQDWDGNNQDFGQIAGFDSDLDGTDNLGEITPDFMPGWNCLTYEQAINAPQDLNTYVDPANLDCGVQPAPVDLDIAQLKVTKSVRIANVKPIGISLVVKNNGSTEGIAMATITGIQNGVEVYSETQSVSDGVGNGRTTVDFMSYTPNVSGEIVWTATIADDDPDVDEASASTNVR